MLSATPKVLREENDRIRSASYQLRYGGRLEDLYGAFKETLTSCSCRADCAERHASPECSPWAEQSDKKSEFIALVGLHPFQARSETLRLRMDTSLYM